MPQSLLIGARIRERRLSLGLRQADLANKIGISPSYLNLIEHNRRRIAGKLLVQVAHVLDVDFSELAQGADQALMAQMQSAATTMGLPATAQQTSEEVIRRFPEWAGVIRDQAARIAQLERTIDVLNDRMTHDPALSTAMHEVLSTVSAVRSTASILAGTPEIDSNWLARFHANLDTDSRRLAQAAQNMVTYFEAEVEQGEGYVAPVEALTAFMDSHDHYLPQVESEGEAALVPLLSEAEASPLLYQTLRHHLLGYLADARAIPGLPTTSDPMTLSQTLGLPLDLIMRRLAVLGGQGTLPQSGLVQTDGTGALLYRRPIDGFNVALVTPGCPLWPLYQAITRPHYPVIATVEMPDGMRFNTWAVARPTDAGTPDVVHATMLIRRSLSEDNAPMQPVGTTCRVCARAECGARREPSIVATS